MRKLLLTLVIFFTINLFVAGVGAQDFTYRIPNPSRYESIEDILNAAASLIRPLFILVFGGMVLYGAWVRMTAKADAEKLSNSVKIILGAGTGFSIAVLAPAITNALTGFLGIEGLTTL